MVSCESAHRKPIDELVLASVAVDAGGGGGGERG